MKNYAFSLWILLFVHMLTISASVEIRSTHMTTAEGLTNNSIRNIFQDSKNFIWMGTQNGLCRYDGNTIVSFWPEGKGAKGKISLADHRIRYITEDMNGFLWISTVNEQYSCYDLKKDCFVDFTGCGEYKEHYGHMMMTDNGDVWLWDKNNGCRKVVYGGQAYSSVAFKKKTGNLPSDNVLYVVQGHQGTIWIGTHEGVVKVEGDKWTAADSQGAFAAFSSNKELFFLSDKGTIFVKEENKSRRNICRLPAPLYKAVRLKNDWLILTADGGYIFDPKTQRATKSPELDITGGNLYTDNRGGVWISNNTGKVRYVNPETHAIKTFQLSSPDKLKYVDMERYSVVHDSRGIIWIATYGNGLFAYDTATEELQHYLFDINGFSHINSNFLQHIIEDNSGGIWVSSEHAGISRLSVMNKGTTRIYPEVTSFYDRSNTIRMIARLNSEDIWIGTQRGGVFAYDSQLTTPKSKQYFNSNIYSVAEGPDGEIWMGSRGNGLCIDGRWYVNKTDDTLSINKNHVFAIYRDRKKRMWIGTFGGGLDLAVKGKNGYTFRHFMKEGYSLQQIRTILEDRNGWIWVGSSAGVSVFHPDSLIANPKNYLTYSYSSGHLQGNEIKCIFQDTSEHVWIGTSGGGFSMCAPGNDYRNLTFKHYDTGNGLVNNVVQSIVEDRNNNIWIATEYGISRFDPKAQTFDNFFFSPYKLGNVYSESSACVNRDGRLLFGTNYGLLIIDPQKTDASVAPVPPVAFTALQVNGITVRPGDADSPLDMSIMYADAFRLKHYQNSFVVDFTSFDYSGTHSGKYTYRLDGYDVDWSKPSTLTFAAYKNLPAGTYALRVKACNAAGIWGNEALLKIVVTPPFWKTGWAFLLYTILLTALLYTTYRLMQNFNSLHTRIQVEKQLTEYKLVFFTNISHEFRTPLTLIQGALEKMRNVDNVPKEMRYAVKVMDKSTQRMLRLINQLLEFRKMQNNKLALSLQETDVMAFLYEIFLNFRNKAESDSMDFRFQPSVASYKMFIDKGNLDKVMYNLLSNAFKYTPAGGKVTLSVVVDEGKKQLVISVSDTGIGISKEKRGELFKRFMQSSFSEHSTGIGLHLTHELVNVHKGTIVYSENVGGGSVFTVSLPTDTGVYEEKNFIATQLPLLKEEAVGEQRTEMDEMDAVMPLNPYKVLIIEDDNDVRGFLREELGQYFEVETASDGVSGFEKARMYDADLIICDILMPGMSGFEVTRKLKGDFDTSHIPIILLTAVDSPESLLEGVESGADAYITKPFSPKLLLTRAFKLIEQREKLRKKFSDDPNMNSPTLCVSDKDKQFADKLQAIVAGQLTNTQLSVNDLAADMGLGRSMFFRKVRGVTGYSPNEYVRIIRMKKAAELLLEGTHTIAEVSHKVGIEDPFYFSKCFKKQFGVSPSMYVPVR